MKTIAIFIITCSMFLAGCEKDYCTQVTNIYGENACEKCFRSQDKLDNFIEEYSPLSTNWEAACRD